MASRTMFEVVENLLREDERLTSEEGFLKNKVMELTLKQDEDLIELLLSEERVKEHFFTEVNGTLVFDKNEFIQFVNNKDFLPNSYTTFKNKIGLTTNGEHLGKKKDVALAWPYKDCILEGEQVDTEEERDEVFWNETLAPDEIDRLEDPKVLTNFKRINKSGKQHNPDLCAGDNLVIEGNNLLALHSLKENFRGDIKLIYVDPPYYFNERKSGDTFGYNTNFKLSTWCTFMKNRLKIARELLAPDGVIFVQISEQGSAYLNLILREIFDTDNFLNTVSVKMKNIAGASGGGENKKLRKNIEFLHIFTKDIDTFSSFDKVYNLVELYDFIEQYREEGISWKYTSVLVDEGKKEYIGSTEDGQGNEIKIYERSGPKFMSVRQIAEKEGITEKEAYYNHSDKIFTTALPQSSIRGRVVDEIGKGDTHEDLYSIEYVPVSGRHKGELYEKYYKGKNLRLITWLKDVVKEKDGVLYKKELQGTYWEGFQLNNLAKEGDVNLKHGKKPEELLKRVINMATDPGDIILDFFAGSGTTGAVAHKMDRQYILCEQLEKHVNLTKERLATVISGTESGISEEVGWEGGGAFVYAKLLEWNQKYIDRIEEAQTTDKLLEIWKGMKEEAFLSYQIDPQQFDDNVEEFKALEIEDQRDFLLKTLDKNHLYVNLSEIDDEEYDISEEVKEMNQEFYGEL